MPTTNEKLSTLHNLILKDATNSRDIILEQLRVDAEQKLTEQKAEIDRQAENDYKRETSRAIQEREARVSRARVSAKKLLMTERNDIIASVLADLKKKLELFTKEDSYRQYLMSNIVEALELVGLRTGSGNSGIIVYITPRDYDRFLAEAEKISHGAKVMRGGDEMIGGCRAENAGIGIYSDNTLNKKADLSIDELFQISGMSIGDI